MAAPTAQQEDLYPSRISDDPVWIPRRDPAVHAPSGRAPESPLTPERVAEFEANGYISIPSLFSKEEVDDYWNELKRLSSRNEIRNNGSTILEPESGDVRSIFNIDRVSDVYNRLARDPRLQNVARYLLNDDVYIHQSRVNFKPGFRGKEFYWHSDFETWHVEDGMPRMRCISASIALTENNEFNGPLMLIPGSHKHFVSCVGETPEENYKSSLQRQEVGVPDDASITRMADEQGIQAPKGPAGSVTFFECNTLHGSSGNISPYPRSNVFFVFNAVSNALVDPFASTPPRPEHIANRTDFTPLTPLT
jgi:ectoine hydroxylase